MLAELPDALGLVGDEGRLRAQEALVPRLRRLVVAHVDPREEVHGVIVVSSVGGYFFALNNTVPVAQLIEVSSSMTSLVK